MSMTARISPLAFTPDDAQRAFDTWGANCGPGALAAVMGLSLEALRPHLGDFERKRYLNPTLMWSALNSLHASWRLVRPLQSWPDYGLARIQWEGPWTAPGVPPRVAYRHTHWVGACGRNPKDVGIFDINSNADWVSLADWSNEVVPFILKFVPGASGAWHLTHVVEIAL